MRQKTVGKKALSRFLKGFISALIHASAITVLVFALMRVLIYDPLSSLSFLAPTENSVDFQMSDIYNAISENAGQKSTDNNIIIVSIDDCADRMQIAHALENIIACQPIAIGVDVMFYNPMERASDMELIEVLNSSTNIVVGMVAYGYNSENRDYSTSIRSFFSPYCPSLKEGFINLKGEDGRSMIRDFIPQANVAGEQTYSFPAELLRLVSPEKIFNLQQSAAQSLQINFKQTDFLCLKMDEVMANRELLAGRIVLIGNIHDQGDAHNTPVDVRMNGLSIHAHTLSTMLEEKYIEPKSKTFDTVWAVLLCFMLSFAGVLLKKQKNLAGGSDILMRFLQFSFMYGCLLVGYTMFVKHNVYSGFAKTLIALGFTAMVLDLWLGLVWLAPRSWRFCVQYARKGYHVIKIFLIKIGHALAKACRRIVSVCKKK